MVTPPTTASFEFTTADINLSEQEINQFKRTASECGYKNLTEYIRFLYKTRKSGNNTSEITHRVTEYDYSKAPVEPFLQTKLGHIYWCDSRSYLFAKANENSVDLIMTSPPFGLVRKKTYGNADADSYCDWFRPFAEGFRRVLKESGSLVIDIGGAWVPGQPTRSLYHFKLLVMLVEEYDFHLCQEHYWWNPSKLPSPAEWVNVRRVRVKDALNTVWWLSRTPFPKANNRRILQPYSKSMKQLLKTGYKAKMRPSGHDISTKFQRNNGGSVPPNLLAIANTESNGRYQDYCRTRNIAIHPARFPVQLPEYFIRFLTEPGDNVLDPFGGSCVTGVVAENLKRRWVCCELSQEYLFGARARFIPTVQSLPKRRGIRYEICSPCACLTDEEEVPLVSDGGAKRPKK